MLVVYTAPGCTSCRKVKAFLKDHNVRYLEKNLFNTLLHENEIRYLLRRTVNGTDDLISPRSKIIRENNIDLDSMSIDELVKFVVANPTVLRRPIIINDRMIQFGYDEDDIESFLPSVKDSARCDKKCAHYDICGRLREER